MNNHNRPTLVLWTSLNCFLLALALPRHGARWSRASQGRGTPGCTCFGFSQPLVPGLKHCLCPAEDDACHSILLTGGAVWDPW